MARLSTTEARDNIADLVNRVAYGGERVVLHRRGKELAVLIPVADLERLEALETAADAAALQEGLDEGHTKPYEQMRRRRGLI
jgi:prevent-host-death family protein